MDNLDTNRIIGDCFEINGDIISMRIKSKLPKFISKIQENFRRNRLIKIVKNLRKANVPLSRDNIIEYFTYIFNNFSPNGEYKSIKGIKHIIIDDTLETWIVMVSVNDEFTAVFKVEMDSKEFSIDLKIPNNDNFITRNLTNLTQVYSDNPETFDYIDKLNKILISDMTDYILDSLYLYKKSKGNTI